MVEYGLKMMVVKAPRLYLKPLQFLPHATIVGMHSDQNGYKTNQYTLFQKQKTGESVQTKEKECLSLV